MAEAGEQGGRGAGGQGEGAFSHTKLSCGDIVRTKIWNILILMAMLTLHSNLVRAQWDKVEL